MTMIPADRHMNAMIAKKPFGATRIVYFLMASWLYYHADVSLLTDERYDRLAKEIDEHWDKLRHRHKQIIPRDALKAGTMYSVPDEAYPTILVHAACQVAGIREPRLIKRAQYADLPKARVRRRAPA